MATSKAEELLHDFHLLTHLNIALYDEQFRCVCNIADQASYCSTLHKSKLCLDRCIRSDARMLVQAKQTHLPQIYACPYGLWEAIYPILDGEHILGYLFIGPAIFPEHAGHLQGLYQLVLSDAPEISTAALREGARSLVCHSREEMDAIERLLALLASHLSANRLVSSSRQTLGYLIKQYVRKNLKKKITLSDISQRLHCSTVTLTESFRREFGMTIMQYVQKERMKLARELLLNTSLSVTDIAERCGFPDVEYFSRCFKKMEGISPSEWRKLRGSS
ncbi:MAG: helix-turn-helix domain-containing protein [Clostridia bacterium]|nr:helix-turn-helix domain-containing protein [Clostridia bacterium]